MKLAAFLPALVLLSAQVNADPDPVPKSSSYITVTRSADGADGAGLNVTLPASRAKLLRDQLWLVIDGKSEGIGGFYIPSLAEPIHYAAHISGDIDTQVKDILKAQGFPVKANVTTYRITAGIKDPEPDGSFLPAYSTLSRTLRFRHDCASIAYTQFDPQPSDYYKGSVLV